LAECINERQILGTMGSARQVVGVTRTRNKLSALPKSACRNHKASPGWRAILSQRNVPHLPITRKKTREGKAFTRPNFWQKQKERRGGEEQKRSSQCRYFVPLVGLLAWVLVRPHVYLIPGRNNIMVSSDYYSFNVDLGPKAAKSPFPQGPHKSLALWPFLATTPGTRLFPPELE
jgi:hypothetical protein